MSNYTDSFFSFIYIHTEIRIEDVAFRLFLFRKTASFFSLKYDDFRIEHSENKICTKTCTYVLLFTEERHDQIRKSYSGNDEKGSSSPGLNYLGLCLLEEL